MFIIEPFLIWADYSPPIEHFLNENGRSPEELTNQKLSTSYKQKIEKIEI